MQTTTMSGNVLSNQASIILPYFPLYFLRFSFQADETVPFRNYKLQGITAQYCNNFSQVTRQRMMQVTCVKDGC